ncbi:hypothetical protein Salat_0833800 [Sesamum alatum]|uniref:Uncharacterized protein n=1 Tax=Sesamum alatum TaxID=300844 RepID=A0AAE1YI75_9LAMI|nr:hypothetical protein Salat_0833800 [Sesamum alatum]
MLKMDQPTHPYHMRLHMHCELLDAPYTQNATRPHLPQPHTEASLTKHTRDHLGRRSPLSAPHPITVHRHKHCHLFTNLKRIRGNITWKEPRWGSQGCPTIATDLPLRTYHLMPTTRTSRATNNERHMDERDGPTLAAMKFEDGYSQNAIRNLETPHHVRKGSLGPLMGAALHGRLGIGTWTTILDCPPKWSASSSWASVSTLRQKNHPESFSINLETGGCVEPH